MVSLCSNFFMCYMSTNLLLNSIHIDKINIQEGVESALSMFQIADENGLDNLRNAVLFYVSSFV